MQFLVSSLFLSKVACFGLAFLALVRLVVCHQSGCLCQQMTVICTSALVLDIGLSLNIVFLFVRYATFQVKVGRIDLSFLSNINCHLWVGAVSVLCHNLTERLSNQYRPCATPACIWILPSSKHYHSVIIAINFLPQAKQLRMWRTCVSRVNSSAATGEHTRRWRHYCQLALAGRPW